MDLPPTPSRRQSLAIGAGASLLLAIVLTWPVFLHPQRLLVGHPGNDNWNHVWGYWWVKEALSRGEWPLHADGLAFPRGGTLYFIDTAQALLAAPLSFTLGPAAAYNFVMIAGLGLSTFGAWLLARRVSGDGLAAGFAAVLYGGAPHLLGQAYNGISETVCAGWLPLTLLALLRVLDRPTLGRATVLGVLAAMTVATSWYYGLFSALAGVLLMVWQAARAPQGVDWRRSIPLLALSGILGVFLVSPLLLAFRSSLDAADAIVSRDPGFVLASLMNHNITDAIAFFRPGKAASPDLLALYGEQLVIVIYLGWFGLLGLGFALMATRRGHDYGPWLLLLAVFFLFSLGPYLNIGGTYWEPFGRRIPLPFLALFEAIPLFDRISHPFRFVVGVSLGTAIGAAVGLRHALRNQSRARQILVVGGLIGATLLETRYLSPASLPIPVSDAHIPTAYTEMAEDPTPGAVLDLPMAVPNLERAIYVWFQAAHGRPVPWGLNEPMPAPLLKNRLTATLIRIEATRARSLPPRLPELDLVVAGRALRREGYRYIVLHQDLYPRFKSEMTEAVLRGAFGEPRAVPEDHLLIWTLEPLP